MLALASSSQTQTLHYCFIMCDKQGQESGVWRVTILNWICCWTLSVTEREREFMVSVILRVCHLGESELVCHAVCGVSKWIALCHLQWRHNWCSLRQPTERNTRACKLGTPLVLKEKEVIVIHNSDRHVIWTTTDNRLRWRTTLSKNKKCCYWPLLVSIQRIEIQI